jgi:hypothetical protein
MLTPEQRKEIARRAAEARWTASGKPRTARATHEGPLNIAGLILPSAVLTDGTRVISQRAFTGALGAPQGGHAFAKRAAQGVADLPIFLADESLSRFISIDLAASLSSPVEYFPLHGGRSAFGVRADLVPAVCDVWLKAREAGALKRSHQQKVAHRAELLMRGLAHIGIIALVDEATGYQDVRSRDALAKILEAFVAKELQPWVRAFPPDFYKEMFRLKRVPYTHDLKRPKYFGHLTNNLVYKRLAPGVLAELRAKNPVTESGRRKHTHHEWLTPAIGHPKLLHHLGKVTALMAISDSWESFEKLLNKHMPVHKHLPLLDGPMPTAPREP